MKLRRNGEQPGADDSLVFTNFKSTEPFIAQADREYEKYRIENRKRFIAEIERRNAEGSYDV